MPEAGGAELHIELATIGANLPDWRGACGLLRTTLCNAGRKTPRVGGVLDRNTSDVPRRGEPPEWGRRINGNAAAAEEV